MTRLDQFRAKIWLMTAISLFFPLFGFAQQNAPVQSRITQAVDENQLTVLRGNVHPLARPEFDRGAAPPDLPMDRMLLVLKRSPAQETALLQLLGMQQDKSSSDYHKWLTPTQFGRQFGPSDDDIQTVTSWLQSHGFQIARVTNGRTANEFSGSASQVKEAFHTEIHKSVVNGEEHWANSSDPQIPSALTPVVAGIATLHNFYKKPQLVRSNQRFTATLTPGGKPQFTNGANGMHALVPADYETIYNIPNPATGGSIVGTGITIAIVGRSNINLQDVQSFRQDFLPLAFAATGPRIQLDGSDPTDLGGGEEAEAVLDTTWTGVVAPGANVVLVVSESTETTDGIDLSELYIVDNNLGDVMSESFGTCEAEITSAEATQISSLAEQAAAQGITYMVSSGDSGAEGCDPNSATVASGPISVNALASTQFTVAVGGTMFNEGATPTKFWSATNKPLPNGGSALSYIPEDVWNESCTGSGSSTCGADIPQANILAGGGGASGTGGAHFQVSKPVWQSGIQGIPADGVRDVPDVSLTAAGHDLYLLCIDNSCTPNGQGEFQLAGVFGTSASSPSFAGIMALVDQKMGGRQGQANYVLYALARGETLSQCNGSSQSGLPASSC
ncbi:MAG: S53 family peptidase, partial [Blastocatellia bacterium]